MTRRRAEEISSGMTVISVFSGCGLLFSNLIPIDLVGKVFGLLCVLSYSMGLFFLLRYPDYFRLESKKDLAKQGLDRDYVSMFSPVFVSGVMATLQLVFWGNVMYWWEPVIAAVMMAVVIGFLFCKFLDYLREKPRELVAAVLLLSFAQAGIIWQVNTLLDFTEPEYVQVEVLATGKRNSRMGPDTYYFVTELNGEERWIQVSVSEFRELPFRENVTIAIHSGGLGMEYLDLVLT